MANYPKYKVRPNKIAEITGFSVGHVYNLLNRHRKVTWPLAEKLAALTGISASWWMRATRKEVEGALADPETWKWATKQIRRIDEKTTQLL